MAEIMKYASRAALAAICLLAMLTPALAAPLNSSLSAYYRFDNNYLDIHKNNTLTPAGTAYNSSCKLGGCYKFDGANDHMDAARGWLLRPSANKSMSFWLLSKTTGVDICWFDFNATVGGSLTGIYNSAGADRNVTVWGLGTPYFPKTNLGRDTYVNNGAWHFITITYVTATATTGTINYYIDGALAHAYASANMQPWYSAMRIGERKDNANDFQGHMDELAIFNDTISAAEVTYLYNSGSGRTYDAIMAGGASPVTSAITFYKPDRPDILNYSTRTLFKIVGADTSYSSVNITINGVKVKTYATLANNTNQTYWFNSSEGNVTIGVYANNTFNATKVFRHLFYNVTAKQYRASVNETTLQQTNITISNASGVIITKVNLTLEGYATENITGGAYLGANKWQNYYYAMVPASDGQTKTLWWNITLRLPTGATQKNRTSYAIAHHFGYNISGAVFDYGRAQGAMWEGGNTRPSVYIKYPSDATTRNGTIRVRVFINGTFNSSAYLTNPSGANSTYRPFFNAPNVVGFNRTIQNRTKIILFNLTVTDKYGTTRTSGPYRRLLRVFGLNISNMSQYNNPRCSEYTPKEWAFRLSAYDEATGNRVNSVTYDVIAKVWSNATQSRTATFKQRSYASGNFTMCNVPSNFTQGGLNGNNSLYENITIQLSKTGYAANSFTVTARRINSTAISAYAIYLTNSTLTTPTTYYLYGTYDAPLAGYTLKIQKLFYGTGAYIDVFSGTAGTDGTVVANVQWYSVYYNYIILDTNGTVVKQFTPSVVSATPVFLRTTSITENWPSIYTGMQTNCVWSNTTKLLSCTLVDSSGTVSYGRLTVTQAQVFGSTTVCTETAYGSAITLTCDLTNTTGNLAWTIIADITGYSEYLTDSGTITQGSPPAITAGNMGMFGALILVMAFGVGGFASGGLGFGLISAVAGWVISGMLGLYALGNIGTEWTVVVGIALAALIALMVHER